MSLPVPEQLETDRLLLRRVRYEDIEPISKFVRDPDSTRYMNIAPDLRTHAGAVALVSTTVESYATDAPLFVLAATEIQTGDVVGTVGASPLPKLQATEIFYNLLPNYRGRGYALESAQALVDYLFNTVQVERVAACIAIENERSMHVAEQLGMHAHTHATWNGMKAALYILETDEYVTYAQWPVAHEYVPSV